MKWWEKTIEYKFIKEFIHLDDFVAPLDGNEEKAGDAIFSNNNYWVLIEFKKDKSSIASEQDKFENYYEAKKELSEKDTHHIIVYGKLNKESKNIDLRAQTYFSEKDISQITKTLQYGIGTNEFKNYLDVFLKYKKGSKVEGGSGGYSFVAGVTNDGQITKCLTLEEFSKEVELSIKLKQEPTRSQSYTMKGPGRW